MKCLPDMKYHIEFDTDFKRNPYKGMYIALEGIDGSGKTTQVALLQEFFEREGKEVVLTREPRKVAIIADINAKVLEGNIDMPREALQYLFTIDRIFNHKEVVLPALNRGAVVITDRCFWSAVAYGVWDMGETNRKDKARQIMIAQGILAMQIQFTIPDMTFYLSLTSKAATKRLDSSNKKKEIYEKKEIIEVVRDTYEWLLQEFPREFEIIDANESIEVVTKNIIERIKNFQKK